MRTILLMLGLSCICLSADWKLNGVSDSVIFFYDEESIEILSNGHVKVWIMSCQDRALTVPDSLYTIADSLRHFYTPPIFNIAPHSITKDPKFIQGVIAFELSLKYRSIRDELLFLVEFNLKEKKWRFIATTDGTIINGAWSYIVPESELENLYKIIVLKTR